MASLIKRGDSPYWWLKYKKDGKWKSASTGLRIENEKETKQAEILKAEASLREKRDGVGHMPSYSWAWVDKWMLRKCKSPRTLEAYKTQWKHLQHWMAVIGINNPREITFKLAHEYITWRTGRRANKKACSLNTAIMETKLLGQIMQQCVLREEIVHNPVQKLGIRRDDPKEKREFTDEEIQKCLDAFDDDQYWTDSRTDRAWMRLSFLIALHTGCRLRETVLRMDMVDLERKTITFASPKGGKGRAFTRPLPDALIPVLAPIKDQEVSHRIPFQPSRCFQNFFARVGVSGVTFHCLRVTYVTRLHRAGVPLSAAMRLVNHSSEVVHRIYTRLNVEDVRAYADVPLYATKPQSPGA